MSNIAVLSDEMGNVIGERDRHSLKPGDMVMITGLWLDNKQGQTLLALRSMQKKVDPGLWGPAAAGTLEPGETFEANIIKEAEEEIGLTGIKPIELKRTHYMNKEKGTGKYAVWFKATADVPIENFTLQQEEVDAVKWVDKDELMTMVQAHPERYVGSVDNWQDLLDLSFE